MRNVSRPDNVFGLTPELLRLNGSSDVILDRDGLLGHHGAPIDPSRAKHVNGLIFSFPDTRFTIVTNGHSDTSPVEAEVIRTYPPFIKQFRPRLLRGLVDDPGKSLYVTDSLSETTVAWAVGFNVLYVRNKLTPHPTEQLMRSFRGPVSRPIGRYIWPLDTLEKK